SGWTKIGENWRDPESSIGIVKSLPAAVQLQHARDRARAAVAHVAASGEPDTWREVVNSEVHLGRAFVPPGYVPGAWEHIGFRGADPMPVWRRPLRKVSS